MKGKKIIITSIIINILIIGIVYNFIKKDYLNYERIIVKAMTEGEHEDYITSLNTSHEDYAKYVEESKKKIASAITDMGVITSSEATPEIMANNIKSIVSDNILNNVVLFVIGRNGDTGLYYAYTENGRDFVNANYVPDNTQVPWGNITITGNWQPTLKFNQPVYAISTLSYSETPAWKLYNSGEYISFSAGRSGLIAFIPADKCDFNN